MNKILTATIEQAVEDLCQTMINVSRNAGLDGGYVALYIALVETEQKLKHDHGLSEKQLEHLRLMGNKLHSVLIEQFDSTFEEWK
jgi:hypothetical protein